MYPEWVMKQHKKGTSIKVINGSYYLYSVTSKRVKGKVYPVSFQKYIGKITEKGLIEPNKISFVPAFDEIVMLGKEDDINGKDKEILNKIPAIKHEEIYFVGKLTNKEIKLIEKYYNYENGKIWR
ncbi:MAG: hypothetical protein NC310_07230 [Roseburia sp.]|nr:hypothetical protein [Anaeroplasma bactoclasticum]MCM1196841.1 hypothetical protein [Roseburia sp.]MCM1557039.1 hypothetical protein [Anaeroplasma bactoclasticum]